MPLKFENGRFRLLRSETASGPSHFVKWYTSHAKGLAERTSYTVGLPALASNLAA